MLVSIVMEGSTVTAMEVIREKVFKKRKDEKEMMKRKGPPWINPIRRTNQ